MVSGVHVCCRSPFLQDTYVPFRLETFQITKSSVDTVICKIALVLAQQTVTRLGILGLFDAVSQICLFQCIQSDDDAVDFGQRFVQVTFRCIVRKLDFLKVPICLTDCPDDNINSGSWLPRTSSRLMVAVRLLEGV